MVPLLYNENPLLMGPPTSPLMATNEGWLIVAEWGRMRYQPGGRAVAEEIDL